MTVEPLGNLVELLAVNEDVPGVGVRILNRHEEEVTFTFADLWKRALAAAGRLREAGVVRGDRVAIVVPTCVEFYDAFFGALCAGATPVPLYPPVRLGRLDEWVDRTAGMLNAVEAATIVADSRTRRILGMVLRKTSLRCGVVAAEGLRADTVVEPHWPAPDDLAFVQFSSGTTRAPTPIAFTHRQILANVDAILREIPMEAVEGGACVSWLPLYHDMGLVGCVLTSMRGQGPLTLIPPELFLARPAIWLRAMSNYRGTVSAAPNFAYALCVEKIRDDEIEGLDLSSWIVAMNGAEPISVHAARAFTDRFCGHGLRATAMTPVYGLAEAALAVTFSPLGQVFESVVFDRDELSRGVAVPRRDGVELPSLGRPLPQFEVEIRDDAGAMLPDHRVGHIWVRGPSITSGYFGQEAPLVEGWLDTGDMGFLRDGELFVCARSKDVVVVRGRNHVPQELERPCDQVEGVRKGCVVAVSDVTPEGERVLVLVESHAPPPRLAEACRNQIRAACGIDPDLVVVVEPGAIPRTSSGKLRRGEALRRWKSGDLVPPREVNARFVAGAMAKSLLGYLRS